MRCGTQDATICFGAGRVTNDMTVAICKMLTRPATLRVDGQARDEDRLEAIALGKTG